MGRIGRACVVAMTLLAVGALPLCATEATLVADAHVSSARPAVNSGALSNLNVGVGYTSLLQFDLNLLPAGTTASQVSRAVLRLYVNRVDTAGVVSVQPVNGSWGESTVTYASLPVLGSAAQVFPVSQAGAYVAVDITALVQGWVTDPASNHGLALSAGTAALQFDSKENDQTAHPAVLDVALVSQGPAGAPGAIGLPGPQGPAGAPGPAGPAGASGVVAFHYVGTYDSTVNYALADVAVFAGSSYISLVGGNHGNTPGLSPAQWGLLAQGGSSGAGSTGPSVAYQGLYKSTANYALNDIVNFSGSSYISLQAGNHGNTPGQSDAYWGLLAQGSTGATGPQGAPGLVYQGTYASAANYTTGDVVTFQGSSFVSLIAQNHGNTPGLSDAQWGLLASGYAGATTNPGSPTVGVSYKGVYASTANYALNDIVLYGASSYLSLVAANHGNTPDQSAAQWGLLAEGGTGIGPAGPPGATGAQGPQGVPGLGYAGTYASTINYGLSDVVGFQGSSYISLIAANAGNTPSQSPFTWGLLAQGGTGPAGAAGAPGAAGPQGPTGATGAQGPVGATGAPGATGPQGLPGLTNQGPYQSAINYNLGDVVLWQGTTYSSLVAENHGNTPDASPAYWGVLSERGPAGTPGATGAAGPQGPQGLPGSVGPPGDRGQQGQQGIAGQAGAQGLTGPTGAQGLPGLTGPQGIPGPVGLSFRGAYQSTVNYGLADGVQYGGAGYVSLLASNAGNTPDQSPQAWALFAAPGANGAAGPAGSDGQPGAAGPAGPAGVAGAAGPVGPTGPQGPAVVNYTGDYGATVNYAARDAVSYAGSTYVSLADGNRGNTPGLTTGFWSVLAAQGPAGAVGAPGAAGPAGAAGAAGVAGPQGIAGPPTAFSGGWSTGTAYSVGTAVSYAGSSYVALVASLAREPDISPQYWGLQAQAGAPGPTGPAGPIGAQGPTGYPGPQGIAGPSGPAGTTGATGATGPAGPQGSGGPVGPQGIAGSPGLAYRGAYAPGTNYAVNDGVSYGGASYISLVAGNQGNSPAASPAAWGLLAQAGVAGPAGATGPAGVQGAAGAAGPTGAPGTSGAPGDAGVTWSGAWSAVTSYQVRDAVLFSGTSYYATAATTGLEPDQYPAAWSVLAQAGSTGPSGPSGPAATVAVGTVTTGAAGSQATVTNRGTNTAAVLDFSLPQGATGTGGGSGGGTAQPLSGLPFLSTYHAVSFNSVYYAINGANSAFGETPGVLTWVPGTCTANRLVVFSEQDNVITLTLRLGSSPGTLADTSIACSVATGNSCTATGTVPIAAGSFVDLRVTGASGNVAGVWTALECD